MKKKLLLLLDILILLYIYKLVFEYSEKKDKYNRYLYNIGKYLPIKHILLLLITFLSLWFALNY